jgi:hypothetical protein
MKILARSSQIASNIQKQHSAFSLADSEEAVASVGSNEQKQADGFQTTKKAT